jgi:rfaE bifunctional protein kinase chain/domain
MNTYTDIISRMSGLHALVIGDVMLDAYIWGSIDRISPEAPVPVVRVKRRDYRLGGAANVALNVKALGATCTLCAVVGTDEAGSQVAERMRLNALETAGLVESGSRPTTVKTRVISGHHHVVRVDEETDASLSSSEFDALVERIDAHLQSCNVVIFEDYDKGLITEELIHYVVEKCRAMEIPVVVDPKKKNFLSYKGVTLFKPNLKELKEGLNLIFEKSDFNAVKSALDTLRETLSCDRVMVTLSEHGIMIGDDSQSEHIPAHIREIADVSGAGDTVISVAALATALSATGAEIAKLSNLAGGLVCEHTGVVPVDLNEFLKEADKL